MEAVKLLVVGVSLYAVKCSSGECPMLLWLTVLAQVLLVDVATKVLAETCKTATRVTAPLLNLIHLVEMAWHCVGLFVLFSHRNRCSHPAEAGTLFALCTFSLSCVSAILSQLWDWLQQGST